MVTSREQQLSQPSKSKVFFGQEKACVHKPMTVALVAPMVLPWVLPNIRLDGVRWLRSAGSLGVV